MARNCTVCCREINVPVYKAVVDGSGRNTEVCGEVCYKEFLRRHPDKSPIVEKDDGYVTPDKSTDDSKTINDADNVIDGSKVADANNSKKFSKKNKGRILTPDFSKSIKKST